MFFFYGNTLKYFVKFFSFVLKMNVMMSFSNVIVTTWYVFFDIIIENGHSLMVTHSEFEFSAIPADGYQEQYCHWHYPRANARAWHISP